MKDAERTLSSWYTQVAATYSADQRKNWYSDVADAYNKVRPRYPQALIEQAIAAAHLPATATLLELGCGPGIATLPFARLGFSMVCLEPSLSACQFAQQHCAPYPAIAIINTTFEEWQLEPEKFHAVLAANAWHWMPPEIRSPKAAAALRVNGALMLLWNMTPQLPDHLYQALDPVYQTQMPLLAPQQEDLATQERLLAGLAQDVIDSGLFQPIVSGQLPCQLTYSIEDYLLLLQTFSTYRKLDPQKREVLFAALQEVLQQTCGDQTIQVTYLSAFQVAHKL